MAGTRDFWFPVNAGEVFTDTLYMTAQQLGILMRLQMYYWNADCKLPSDPVQIARRVNISTLDTDLMKDLQEVLDDRFVLDEQTGQYTYPPLDELRLTNQHKRLRDSINGKKGVEARMARKVTTSNLKAEDSGADF